MDEKTIKIIKEKFDSLPKNIQDVIMSTNYQDAMIEIGKRYNLNVEQMGTMEMETTMVMMGLTPTQNFESELMRELHVDATKGNQVVTDINTQVFAKIRESLKAMSAPKEKNPEPEETENRDAQILNSAGIKMVEPSLPTRTMDIRKEELVENREDMLKRIEKAEPKTLVATNVPVPPPRDAIKTSSILVQKLSGSVQIPMVKTEHSLENITKVPSTPSVVAKIPNIDPYREIPE